MSDWVILLLLVIVLIVIISILNSRSDAFAEEIRGTRPRSLNQLIDMFKKRMTENVKQTIVSGSNCHECLASWDVLGARCIPCKRD